MRQLVIAGNWKMHKTPQESVDLVEALKPLVEGVGHEVVVCPPATSLLALKAVLADSAIGLGAQNMHWEEEGAFTGEVSPQAILTCGCAYVILGHSERRQLFGETDEAVNRKVGAALAAGLIPIACVGETLDQREAGRVQEVVLGQVGAALEGLEAAQVAGMILAYEPVWAIGTGRTATPQQAEEVHGMIRAFIAQGWGEAAAALRIQYGGSVKPDNAAELFAQANIDGGLIGGASLEAESFAAIVKAVS